MVKCDNPFSYYNRHLSRFPSLSPQLRLCETFDGFLPNSPSSQICHFRENRQLSICLFCKFRKIAICQDVPFCHLTWIFGRSLDDFLVYSPFLPKFPFFAQNLSFSYNRHLSRFPCLPPQLRFCKSFDGFLLFSLICGFRENCQLPIGLFCCLIEIFCQTFDESLTNSPISQNMSFS